MLPTKKTQSKHNLIDFTMLISGASKIGKSTLCAEVPGALFLATEPGLNALDVYQTPINSYPDFLAACKEIAKGKHTFKTIIVDTIDNLYRFISEDICKKQNITHESDLGYGKGWSMVNSEFQRILTRLAHLPYGLILISHSQEIAIETRTGNRTKIVPSLPDKPRKILTSLVDFIFYCDIEVTKNENGESQFRRVLRTKPTHEYEAGDRTGRLPETIELNYQALSSAFKKALTTTKKAA